MNYLMYLLAAMNLPTVWEVNEVLSEADRMRHPAYVINEIGVGTFKVHEICLLGVVAKRLCAIYLQVLTCYLLLACGIGDRWPKILMRGSLTLMKKGGASCILIFSKYRDRIKVATTFTQLYHVIISRPITAPPPAAITEVTIHTQ